MGHHVSPKHETGLFNFILPDRGSGCRMERTETAQGPPPLPRPRAAAAARESPWNDRAARRTRVAREEPNSSPKSGKAGCLNPSTLEVSDGPEATAASQLRSII